MTFEHEHSKLGLALGGGAARGWAHIGIIKELADMGIKPDVICGCSVGAIVGASFVAGNLDKLEQWVCQFTRRDIVSFIELDFSFNGFVDAARMRAFMSKYVCATDQLIEDMDMTFATVSAELGTGREVWFTKGLMVDAVWASMSLPGLFPPLRHEGRWLVDGGLVNPVPVSVCRALGADVVIAVNLNDGMVGKRFKRKPRQPPPARSSTSEVLAEAATGSFRKNGRMLETLTKNIRAYSDTLFSNGNGVDSETPPNVFDAIAGSINITQDRITRSRMAGDPPDITLAPTLSRIGLLEFFRAAEAIEGGRECVNRMSPEIHRVLNESIYRS